MHVQRKGDDMKSVLISIQPKWCELIASGKKTVEVRKTKPKLETPFKVFIYETKNNDTIFAGNPRKPIHLSFGMGKIIGEFVCDEISEYTKAFFDEQEERDTYDIARFIYHSRINYEDLCAYVGLKNFYAWHISDLVIYDEPRELGEFYAEGDCDCLNCKNCAWFDKGNGYNVEDDCNLAYKGAEMHKSFKPITRPPQSWCYVEE